VAGTLLDQCHACGGVWVDQEAFERISAESETQQSTLRALGRLPTPPSGTVPGLTKVVYLRCPDCDKMMNRRNFAKRSGIIIDVCSAHGIWFDHEELPRIIQYVRRGGLEESRRRDLEELRNEAGRLRQQMVLDRSRGRRSDSGGFFSDSSLASSGEGVFAVADLLSVLFD
jgi:Zn-finger nucleic acid-binding protein